MNEHKHGIPVIVNLAALASYDGVNDDPIQMLISGELFPGKSATTLHYIENLEDEETGEITKSEIQLILAKDQVTMNRSGHFSNTNNVSYALWQFTYGCYSQRSFLRYQFKDWESTFAL